MSVSIITTCKGRLHYLLQALPEMVRQQTAEVIVVDFDCPQDTADVVQAKFPGVRTIKIDDRPVMNLSEARNIGAANANGDVLAFIDCDIVLANDFLDALNGWSARTYGEFVGINDIRGTCVVPRDAFLFVGGYDEVITAYGAEDLDLYTRLRLVGLERIVLSNKLIARALENTPEERVRYHDIGRKLSFARGRAYRELKSNLLLLSRRPELDLQLRRHIWAKLSEMVTSPDIFKQEHYIEIALPSNEEDGMLPGCVFTPSVRLGVRLAK